MKLPSRIPQEATKVFDGIIYDIYQWQQQLFDGSYATFEMAKKTDAVSIIPIINNNLVILNEEQPRGDKRVSFPGGQMDADEMPMQAAIRELQEETGMIFKTLKLVAIDDLGSGKLDWWIYRFIATDFIKSVPPKLDPGEKIVTKTVSFDQAKQLSINNYFMSLSVMNNVESIKDLVNYPEIEILQQS